MLSIVLVLMVYGALTLTASANDFGEGDPGVYYNSQVPWDVWTVRFPKMVDNVLTDRYYQFSNPVLMSENGIRQAYQNDLQYDIEFVNSQLVYDEDIRFNNVYLDSHFAPYIETTFSLPIINQENSQVVTLALQCNDVLMTGSGMLDFFNNITLKVNSIGGTERTVICQWWLSFESHTHAVEYRWVDNNRLLYTVTASQSREARYANYSGMTFNVSGQTRLTYPDIEYAPLNLSFPDFMERQTVCLNADYGSGESEPVRTWTTYSGLTDVSQFSVVRLYFRFEVKNCSRIILTLSERTSVQNQDTVKEPTWGKTSLGAYAVGPFSFESVVTSVGSFFDMRVGGFTLGELGMFAFGIIFVTIFIKLFKGG